MAERTSYSSAVNKPLHKEADLTTTSMLVVDRDGERIITIDPLKESHEVKGRHKMPYLVVFAKEKKKP